MPSRADASSRRIGRGRGAARARRGDRADDCDRCIRCSRLHLPGAADYPAFRLLVFRGYGPSGTLQAGDDAEAVGWFGIDEMQRLPVIPSVLETAQAIVADESARSREQA